MAVGTGTTPIVQTNAALPTPVKAEAHRRGRPYREWLTSYAFLIPAFIVIGGFTFVAMAIAIFISFFKYDGFTLEWAGLHNYAKALGNADFHKALLNVLYYMLVVVTFQTILALTMALVLDRIMVGRGVFRTVYYLPAITSSVVMGLIFGWLFSPGGWVGSLVGIFIPGLRQFGWLLDPLTALPAIMTTTIWSTAATFMIVFISGIQDIPTHVYEAAKIDGAVGWRSLWNITIPLLRPTIFLVVVLGTIGTLQVFDQVYVMTNGGPLKSTLTPVFLMYTTGFRDFTFGLGSAEAFILFAIIFAFTLIQRRFIDTTVEY
jgi:multiple sugar transport system permease protein